MGEGEGKGFTKNGRGIVEEEGKGFPKEGREIGEGEGKGFLKEGRGIAEGEGKGYPKDERGIVEGEGKGILKYRKGVVEEGKGYPKNGREIVEGEVKEFPREGRVVVEGEGKVFSENWRGIVEEEGNGRGIVAGEGKGFPEGGRGIVAEEGKGFPEGERGIVKGKGFSKDGMRVEEGEGKGFPEDWRGIEEGEGNGRGIMVGEREGFPKDGRGIVEGEEKGGVRVVKEIEGGGKWIGEEIEGIWKLGGRIRKGNGRIRKTSGREEGTERIEDSYGQLGSNNRRIGGRNRRISGSNGRIRGTQRVENTERISESNEKIEDTNERIGGSSGRIGNTNQMIEGGRRRFGNIERIGGSNEKMDAISGSNQRFEDVNESSNGRMRKTQRISGSNGKDEDSNERIVGSNGRVGNTERVTRGNRRFKDSSGSNQRIEYTNEKSEGSNRRMENTERINGRIEETNEKILGSSKMIGSTSQKIGSSIRRVGNIESLDESNGSTNQKMERSKRMIRNTERVYESIGITERVGDSIGNIERIGDSIGNIERIGGSIGNTERVKESIEDTEKTIEDTNENLPSLENTKTKQEIKNINKINRKPVKIQKIYADLISDYATNTNSKGKLFAGLIKTKDIIVGEFTTSGHERLMKRLHQMNRTSANLYDYNSHMVRFINCVYNSTNGKLNSALNSLVSQIKSKLQKIESMTTLTSVFTLTEILDTSYNGLLEFLNCNLDNVRSTTERCSEKLVKDLESLKLDLLETSSIDDHISMLCWMKGLFFVTEVEYETSNEWLMIIENFLQELKNPRTWFLKLRVIFDNGNSMSQEEIHDQFGNLLKELISYNDFDVSIMRSALMTVKDKLKKLSVNISCQMKSVITLTVTGEFLRLSHILNQSLCRDYKILEIFALNRIIIDQDLMATGREMLVSIFAPVWEVVMNRRIVLDGASRNLTEDDYMEPKGKNGNKLINRNGADGLAGLPGGPAGTFYGLAEEIIGAKQLTISLNGGNGSNGQDGGNGANGEDGETPSKNYIHSMFSHQFCRWVRDYDVDYRATQSELERHFIPPLSRVVLLRFKDECYIYGLNGFPGGNGGHGGKSGKGSSAGDFHLCRMKNSTEIPVVLATNGSDGSYGIGGTGGSGGFSRKVTVHNENYFDYKVVENVTDVRAPHGVRGKDNSSILGRKIRPEGEIPQTFAQTVNLYKRLLTDSNLQLYRQVIDNMEIRKNFDTLALVNELIDLEQYYFGKQKKRDTLFMYKSWKERLIYHAWHRKPVEDTEEHTAIFRTLDSMVSEKVQRLETNSDRRLIFKLSDYLSQCEDQVKYLQNARTVVRIKKINKNFIRECEDKVKEAQGIIHEKLQKDIQETNQNLKGETEMLLRQISSLTERERRNNEVLLKKSKAMEGRLVAKDINEIFDLMNTVLGFINPALGRIGTKFSTAGSIVQNFFDETADSSVIEVAIPNMVDRSREFFDNWVDVKTELQEVYLQNNLEMIEGRKNHLEEKGENVEPLQSVELSLKALKPDSGKLPGDVMKLLDDRLTKEKSIWQKLNESKNQVYKGALKAIDQIRTFTRIKQMVGDLSEKFQDIKGQRHMMELGEEIHKAFEKTVGLRNFKEEVYMKMIPLIGKIRDETDLGNFSATSIAYLDFKKFQMKEYFQEVLDQLKLFVKQFHLEELFESTLANMEEVIDMVLSTYKRIQEYIETMKNADYEKDLSLAPFDVTYVKNPELSTALAKMIQTFYANIVLDNYYKWMASFKQYIFPFAEEFIGVHDSLPELSGILAKAEEAGKRLDFLRDKWTQKRAEFAEFEKTYPAKFGYDLPPFHVWNNSRYDDQINRILEGERVTLVADIFKNKFMNAVKFSKIWLRLRATDPSIKDDGLSNDLRGFAFKLEHNGESYYRCDDEIYLIKSQRHLFENVYNTSEDDQFREYESEKQKSDYLLSPYTTWKIELISRDVDKNFEMLRKYHSKVNIELVGLGRYTDYNLKICETNLTKYYKKLS